MRKAIWFMTQSYPTHCGAVLGLRTCRSTSNEIADKLTRGSSIQKFIGPEPSQGVPRQNIKNKIKCWVGNQHLVMWCGAQELISGPSLATKAQLLSFNTTKSRVVTGILTRQNTLRRPLYVMGLSNNPTCRKCGTEEEISSFVHPHCVLQIYSKV